jgi:hypothetical protein
MPKGTGVKPGHVARSLTEIDDESQGGNGSSRLSTALVQSRAVILKRLETDSRLP